MNPPPIRTAGSLQVSYPRRSSRNLAVISSKHYDLCARVWVEFQHKVPTLGNTFLTASSGSLSLRRTQMHDMSVCSVQCAMVRFAGFPPRIFNDSLQHIMYSSSDISMPKVDVNILLFDSITADVVDHTLTIPFTVV